MNRQPIKAAVMAYLAGIATNFALISYVHHADADCLLALAVAALAAIACLAMLIDWGALDE